MSVAQASEVKPTDLGMPASSTEPIEKGEGCGDDGLVSCSMRELFEQGTKIATHRKDNVFQELDKRTLSEEEELVIKMRVGASLFCALFDLSDLSDLRLTTVVGELLTEDITRGGRAQRAHPIPRAAHRERHARLWGGVGSLRSPTPELLTEAAQLPCAHSPTRPSPSLSHSQSINARCTRCSRSRSARGRSRS